MGLTRCSVVLSVIAQNYASQFSVLPIEVFGANLPRDYASILIVCDEYSEYRLLK
jgi:hypothetical protein